MDDATTNPENPPDVQTFRHRTPANFTPSYASIPECERLVDDIENLVSPLLDALIEDMTQEMLLAFTNSAPRVHALIEASTASSGFKARLSCGFETWMRGITTRAREEIGLFETSQIRKNWNWKRDGF
jgi:hypothetical protein